MRTEQELKMRLLYGASKGSGRSGTNQNEIRNILNDLSVNSIFAHRIVYAWTENVDWPELTG